MSSSNQRGKIRYLWALLLSWFAPGAGQVYAGNWNVGLYVGITFCVCVLLLRLTMHFLPPSIYLGIFIVCVLLAFTFWNIRDSLRRIKFDTVKKPRPWRRSVTIFVVAQGIVTGMTGLALPLNWRILTMPSVWASPTIMMGDVLLTDCRPSISQPVRGELVIIRTKVDKRRLWAKRVIGLAGDHVQIRSGILYLNESAVARRLLQYDASVYDGDRFNFVKLYEETLPEGRSYDIEKSTDRELKYANDDVDLNNTPVYIVPDNRLFVLSDFRDDALDSRSQNKVGFVAVKDLACRPTTILYSRAPWEFPGIRWERINLPIN